ncbi:MAG: hypothetical protein ACJ8EK_01695, partial [Bradyrhizobium sp.]
MLFNFACEAAGAVGARHSPRPLWAKFLYRSDAMRREAAEVRLVFSEPGPIVGSALDVRRGFAIL